MSYLPGNITTIRKRWRESMEAFGERFGMSRTNIGRYEASDYEPSVSFILKLAVLTGISVERLALSSLQPEEVPALPIGEGGEAMQVREPEDPARMAPPSNDIAALLEAIAALRSLVESEREAATHEREENNRLRKRVESIEKRLELLDTELLRLGGKHR